ncbi:iron ABC transporter permease [Agromyces atrinae]|uniref:FecCD family ABC transporter permease n=1 Tax=Agromyces atrinae TaxID=592376 RepID=UPI001F57AB50|nr:iron ABC transporter permease [Agromyces atrinae]MCI2958103.1 iron ABC transporter permease [Agromyces atrinae]
MTALAQPVVSASSPTKRRVRLLVALVVTIAVLALIALASLAIGTRQVAFPDVIQALVSPVDGNADHLVVRELRIPRLVVGLMAGVALGLVGTVLQGVTRNPIADPGLLGINAGASFAVVLAIATLGVTQPLGFVWFAFGGAALAALLVFVIGSSGRDGATPVKLALTGAALTALLTPLVTLVLIGDGDTLARFRFWSVGSLAGRGLDVAAALWPFLVAGVVVAALLGRRLNLLALGDDVARGLGARLGTTRVLAAVAVIVLAGTATSLVGPIALVGLVVPHLARPIAGGDYRWILVFSALFGPALLLAADVVGRVVVAPAELEAGIIVAFIGAPVLIAIVRRSTVRSI